MYGCNFLGCDSNRCIIWIIQNTEDLGYFVVYHQSAKRCQSADHFIQWRRNCGQRNYPGSLWGGGPVHERDRVRMMNCWISSTSTLNGMKCICGEHLYKLWKSEWVWIISLKFFIYLVNENIQTSFVHCWLTVW